MYAERSFETKKALKDAVAAGRQIGVFQAGGLGGPTPVSGKVSLEGPNFKMHKWYAEAWLENGIITKVK